MQSPGDERGAGRKSEAGSAGYEEHKATAERTDGAESVFFPVSIVKLVLLNVFSFNIYSIFWMYKNWKYLKENQQRKCLPFVRAIFGPIFFFSLCPAMHRLIKDKGGVAPALHPVAMAVIYLVFSSLNRIDNRVFHLAAIVAVVPFVLLQVSVNNLNGGEAAVGNKRLSAGNWVMLVLGALLWAGTLILI